MSTGAGDVDEDAPRHVAGAPLPAAADPAFERFARLVSTQLGTPAAVVSVLGDEEQVFPGALGLPGRYQRSRRTPLELSLCRDVVATAALVAHRDVPGAASVATGARIARELGVVAYAGAPVRDVDGVVVGALCALDHAARDWTDVELQVLEDLAAACSSELGLRQARARADRASAAVALAATAELAAQARLRAADERFRLLLLLSEGLSDVRTLTDVVAAVSRLAHRHLGTDHAGVAALDRRRSRLDYRTVDRLGPEAAAAWADQPVDRTGPVGTVLRSGRAEHHRDHASLLEAHPALVGSPLLQGLGARAVLPLQAGGRSRGALVLSWAGPQDADQETRAVMSGLARYTAQAMDRVELLAERGHAAETLQRALLTDLPQPDHLQLHARYLPAADTEQVGGDWYDAVVMPDGATTLVIGDVVGHDMVAAAQMGQLRSTTRTLAWAFEEPASAVLTRVDQAVAGLRMPTMATVLLARVEQPEDLAAEGMRRLRWSNAGHPPPLLVGADGGADFLDRAHDMLLGLLPTTPRHDHLADLPPGSTLLLYTDGLVERRGRTLDDGLEQLRAAAARHAGLTLPELVDALLRELVHDDPAARDPRTSDDVAVLAVRMHPEDRPRPPEAGPGHL